MSNVKDVFLEHSKKVSNKEMRGSRGYASILSFNSLRNPLIEIEKLGLEFGSGGMIISAVLDMLY